MGYNKRKAKTSEAERSILPDMAKERQRKEGLVEHYFLDVAFLVNFLMDYLLLWLVRIWRGYVSKGIRIAAAAAFGALCSCLPDMVKYLGLLRHLFGDLLRLPALVWLRGLLALLYMLACAAVMCIIAFGKGRRAFLKNYFTLLFLAFVAGGIIYSFTLASRGTFGQQEKQLVFTSLGLTLLTAFSVLIFFLIRLLYREEKKQLIYPVRLVLFGQQFDCQGLLDTGNCLYDPFYGKPVVLFTDEKIYHTMQKGLAEEPGKTRFVPFHSVGKEQGILAGMELTELAIQMEDRELCWKNVVAVYAGHTFSGKGYQVILHPDLM